MYSARFMGVDAVVKNASRNEEVAGSIHGSGRGLVISYICTVDD